MMEQTVVVGYRKLKKLAKEWSKKAVSCDRKAAAKWSDRSSARLVIITPRKIVKSLKIAFGVSGVTLTTKASNHYASLKLASVG